MAAFENPPLTVWQQTWRFIFVVGFGLLMFLATVASAEFEREEVGSPSIFASETLETAAAALLGIDMIFGVLAVILVAFRRRAPLLIFVLIALMSAVSISSLGALFLAIASLATKRRPVHIAVIIPLVIASAVFYELVVLGAVSTVPRVLPEELPAFLSTIGLTVATLAACIAVGWSAGSRRELVWTLRREAETAMREQASRVGQAKLAERGRIAREMHDVLAHRLSLVAMHAGALSHRQDLSAEEKSAAAETIRQASHLALEELRDILGVLRDEERQGIERPQPGFHDIPTLIAERTSDDRGERITLDADEELWARAITLPTATGRHVYRIVQEGLTNARKHAPGQPVRIEISGREGATLDLTISNPIPGTGRKSAQTRVDSGRDGVAAGRDLATIDVGAESLDSAPLDFRELDAGAIPGAGMGLMGISERVNLAGGTILLSRQGSFIVSVCLPWPEREEVAT